MQRRFVLIGVTMLALTLTLSLLVSRRLTRPLRLLADAANEIATGNWTRQVPTNSGTAESRMMATAFNDMTATLSHWHQEAATRSAQLQDAYERFRAVTECMTEEVRSTSSNRSSPRRHWARAPGRPPQPDVSAAEDSVHLRLHGR